MTSILEQVRQEGRQEARQNLSQLTAMEREETYEQGKREGWFEGQRQARDWNAFYFFLGLSLTVLIYELVLYP